MSGGRFRNTQMARAAGRPSAARRGLTVGQWLFWSSAFAILALGAAATPVLTGQVLFFFVQAAFAVIGLWRLLLIATSRRAPPPVLPDAETTSGSIDVWPRYTVLAALHDEAAVVPQLIRRLSALDYPADRLQGMLLLEADDAPTLAAALTADRPAWLEVVVVPDGLPRTKPRALNHGLARATGDLVTIYDAEDEPHPGQLREAASIFAADRQGDLACIQAPLRIRPAEPDVAFGSRFLGRQFAIEYGCLFEVVVPAMTRMGLPFPLGGTSNHFRMEALKSVGGWDAWNVTEDADLGLALWRDGWRLGAARLPTLETAPATLHDWLPQRTRWLKGYLQTWGVHTRDLPGLGWRGTAALLLSIGGPLASAATHAVSIAAITALILVPATAGLAPRVPLTALGVLGFGLVIAWLAGAIGAKRAGAPCTPLDLLAAPIVWALTSLALFHAAWRLLREPFAWDKTAHRPDPVDLTPAKDGSGPVARPLPDDAAIYTSRSHQSLIR